MIRRGSSSVLTCGTGVMVALAVGVVGLGVTAVRLAPPASAGVPSVSPQLAVAFEWAIDVERAHVGLGPLIVDATVSQQAQEWSGGMALFNNMAETGTTRRRCRRPSRA